MNKTTVLNESFFTESNGTGFIKQIHRNALELIYSWIASPDHPIRRKMDGRIYYLINYGFMARKLNATYDVIRGCMKRLFGMDRYSDVRFFRKKETRDAKGNRLIWVSVDNRVANKALNHNSLVYKELFDLKKKRGRKVDCALFEDESTGLERFSDESIAIANRALEKYSDCFANKAPSFGANPTKSYTDALRKITDLYNGNFSNPHIYDLRAEFYGNKQFKLVEGWQAKADEVKGDWGKVRALVFKSLANFRLMHDKHHAPFDKKYLTNDFSKWLYDEWGRQSQFIQGFEEPWLRTKVAEDEKTDKIFESLPGNARRAGNKFVDLDKDKNVGAVSLWQGMRDIMDWGKAVFECDREHNVMWWVESSSEIALKFYDFIVENNIKISSSTFNLEKSVEYNLPWKWFISDAVHKYKLPKGLSLAWNPDMVREVYRKNKSAYDVYDEFYYFR